MIFFIPKRGGHLGFFWLKHNSSYSCILLFQCNNGGCLIELAQQLAVIMIGKQVINNAQEILLP